MDGEVSCISSQQLLVNESQSTSEMLFMTSKEFVFIIGHWNNHQSMIWMTVKDGAEVKGHLANTDAG